MTKSRWLKATALSLFLCMGTSQASASDVVAERLTDLKSQALSTQRDLNLLQREITYSKDQLVVYLAVDIDTRFELLTAELKVNGNTIKRHRYNTAETQALRSGGLQPLLITNMTPGAHKIEVLVSAKNQKNTVFTQTEVVDLVKTQATKVLNLQLSDNLNTQQYRFGVNEWND